MTERANRYALEPSEEEFHEASLRDRSHIIVQRAKALEITNGLDYEDAGESRKAVREIDRQAEEFFAPMREAAHKAHRAICDREAQIRAPLKDALKIIDGKLAAWQMKQEEIAAAARAAAEAEARARAERVREADPELADAIEMAPLAVPEPAAPKIEGLSSRKTVTARVTNIEAAVCYIVTGGKSQKAARPEYMHLIQLDQKALNALARALGDRLSIAGVTLDYSRTFTQRS